MSTENWFDAYQQQQWKHAGKNEQKLCESETAGSVLCTERRQSRREGHGSHRLFNTQHESLNQANVDGKKKERKKCKQGMKQKNILDSIQFFNFTLFIIKNNFLSNNSVHSLKKAFLNIA